MKLKQAFVEAVSAGYGGIWVRSPEHEDAQRTIAETCNFYHWKMMLFDLDKGFRIVGEEESTVNDPSFIGALKSALSFSRKLAKIAEGEENEDFQAILVVRNIHFCLNNTKNIQALQHVVEEGAAIGLHVLGLSLDGVKVPPELEKYFYPINHDLPNLDELYDLAADIDDELELPEKGSKEAEELLANVTGLSRMEAMGAYGISLARHRKIDPTVLAEVKTATMEMGGLLSPKKSSQGFDAIAGCDHVKDFLKAGILSPNRAEGVKLRSAMLVGWPGTGKSWLSECLGFEVNRPTVAVDVGALKGSLVGQTEANTRRALKTLDAMAPCIAFFDEIEKSVTTDAMDSGASSGQLGALLTWMNDHTSDVFCIFTSNDISKLPPEFLRAERMDGIFYFGCPTREAKDRAWEIYEYKFGIGDKARKFKDGRPADRPDDTNWTPAEIKTCCRLAALFGRSLQDSAAQVVPVYNTNREKIDALSKWAENRCLSADEPGVYTLEGVQKKIASPGGEKPRRRVRRSKQTT